MEGVDRERRKYRGMRSEKGRVFKCRGKKVPEREELPREGMKGKGRGRNT